ncbi:Imm48 family immunity protein [Paenibacillus lentus]|uniref:Imm48 family immunity protein n=1 Tax=Paenibacillus lentus TaxID=1338368 RepID=UPI003649D542
MSNFYELSEEEKQIIEDTKGKVAEITSEIFMLLNKQFDDTTELERQILATFCFGIINGIVFERDIPPLQAHSITHSLLVAKFNYSEDQAEDFTQELINSTDEEYHPVMFSIIRRGIDGYRQYFNDDKAQLRANIIEVLDIINSESD